MKRFLRALPVFVAAILLAGGAVATHPHQAKAFAACWWSDQTNVPYTDWYASTSVQTHDFYGSGADRTILTDIQAYRYSGSDGNCYRGYYVSVWTADGSGCNCDAQLSIYDNIGTVAVWDNGTIWGSRQQVVSYVGSNHLSWGRYGDLTSYVRFPSGAYGDLDFYRMPADKPRADNLGTSACSPTWYSCPQSGSINNFYVGWR